MGGMKFLITAGPTREALDPVRYLTNRSTGRMGYALAGAARHEGHDVVLISGPTTLDVPEGVDFIQVETAQQMYDTVRDLLRGVDVAILCAAVADYRPVSVAEHKIKKSEGRLVLELERTPDILGSMRSEFGYKGVLVGFAAETQDLVAHAREKLLRKGCDMIVANDVSRPGIGFGSRENEVTLITADRAESLPRETKEWLAMRIVEHALSLLP
ncbi:MAG: phosphopantothenoylcysteine decarboxylase [Akkermansiaceae bacterium]|nr:phosphopantothenoylcysteine decarboxylase [Akkermansiaceae bacterium]